MGIVEIVSIFETVFFVMTVALVFVLGVAVFGDKAKKWGERLTIITSVIWFISCVGFLVTNGELNNYRDDFVINHIFSEEKSVIIEETHQKRKDYVIYKVKLNDKRVTLDVDYSMQKDATFDYYVQDELVKGKIENEKTNSELIQEQGGNEK